MVLAALNTDGTTMWITKLGCFFPPLKLFVTVMLFGMFCSSSLPFVGYDALYKTLCFPGVISGGIQAPADTQSYDDSLALVVDDFADKTYEHIWPVSTEDGRCQSKTGCKCVCCVTQDKALTLDPLNIDSSEPTSVALTSRAEPCTAVVERSSIPSPSPAWVPESAGRAFCLRSILARSHEVRLCKAG